jgi:Tfp pilus tip-associated adhesin PilY1
VGVFFSAGPAQPFFVKGAATMDPAGNLWFFIGSGDRGNPLLVPATANRIYGIKDPYVGTPIAALTEADLTNMTLNNTLNASAVSGQGWYVILRAGEKEWAETALVFNSQVFFTTFMPGSTTCGDVGSGTIYMVYYLTGGGVTDTALFESSPPAASSRIYQVNAGATTRPVVTTGTLGANAVVYLANSNMLTLTPSFSAPSSIRATRYWIRVR